MTQSTSAQNEWILWGQLMAAKKPPMRRWMRTSCLELIASFTVDTSCEENVVLKTARGTREPRPQLFKPSGPLWGSQLFIDFFFPLINNALFIFFIPVLNGVIFIIYGIRQIIIKYSG